MCLLNDFRKFSTLSQIEQFLQLRIHDIPHIPNLSKFTEVSDQGQHLYLGEIRISIPLLYQNSDRIIIIIMMMRLTPFLFSDKDIEGIPSMQSSYSAEMNQHANPTLKNEYHTFQPWISIQLDLFLFFFWVPVNTKWTDVECCKFLSQRCHRRKELVGEQRPGI